MRKSISFAVRRVNVGTLVCTLQNWIGLITALLYFISDFSSTLVFPLDWLHAENSEGMMRATVWFHAEFPSSSSLSFSLSLFRSRRSIRIKIAAGPVRGWNPCVPDRERKNGNRGLISIRPYHFRFAFPTIALPFPTDVFVFSVSLVFAIETRSCSLSEYITSSNSYKYKTKLPSLSFIPIGA